MKLLDIILAWISCKVSVTVWEQRHGTVRHTFQVNQMLDAITAAHAISGQWGMGVFFPVSADDVKVMMLI